MFMQETDTDLKNMEFSGNNYLGSVPNQAWSTSQNCLMSKTEIWPTLAHNNFFIEDPYNPSHNNASFTPSSSATNVNCNRSEVVSDSFRQQASIADWEAYLYSPISNPIKNTTQSPVGFVNGESTQNTTNHVTPKTNHRAHITFVHSSNGVFKPIVKSKRKRTTFTTEQVEALETIFYKRPYINREDRQVLMEKLQVSDKAIKVWFQNRRLKVKKEKEEQEMESSDSETLYTQETKPLDYVEAQMYKADRFGYVTLDDRAINELVNVIDNFLPQDAFLGGADSERSDSVNRLCSVSESESSVIYEPISPPDLSDTNSQDTFIEKWKAFEAIEPKKSFQNLLNAHMCECKDAVF